MEIKLQILNNDGELIAQETSSIISEGYIKHTLLDRLMKTYNEYVDKKIEQGECPECGRQLRHITENVGFATSPHVESHVVCDICGEIV